MDKESPIRVAFSTQLILSLIALLLTASACFAHDQQSASPICQLPASADVRRLEAGTIIERELAGGPTHFYEINVSAGQDRKSTRLNSSH